MSMRANAAHGNKNTVEDRVMMVNKLIQMDEQRFMSNPYAVNIPEVMAALQITRNQARTVIEPKNAELKERRNAAILEMHKEGKKPGSIDSVLGLGNGTAKNVIESEKKVETTNFSESPSPSCLPQANTEDRPDTRKP